MSYQPLRAALRGMIVAFAPWSGKTVKQEEAIAAAERVLKRHDLRAEIVPDISPESREIIGDAYGTIALISDEPFSLEEVDTLLKVQRARMTKPSALVDALKGVARSESD